VNKKLTIALAVATLFLGVILGERFRNKFIQRNKSVELVKSINNIPVPKNVRSKADHNLIENNTLGFAAQLRENQASINSEDSLKAVKVLRSIHNRVRLVVLPKENSPKLKVTPTGNRNYASGCISGNRFIKIIGKGPKLKPLFYGSSDSKFSMYNESQVITTGNLPRLEDLSNKIVGVDEVSLNDAALILNDLNLKSIRAKKIIVFKDRKKGFSELTKKNIDSLIVRVHVFSNGRVENKLGLIENNHFFQYPDLKIIHTTHYKIPSRIIFVSEKIPKQNKREIEARIEDLFQNPKNLELRKKLFGIASVSKLLPEEIPAIAKTIHSAEMVNLKSLSSEVLEDN
jgi:hypothetical protein